MSVLDTVISIVATQLEVSLGSVSESSGLEELGADSPHLLEIVLTLEEQFKIKIPDRDAKGLKTVRDVVKYVSGHAGQ